MMSLVQNCRPAGRRRAGPGAAGQAPVFRAPGFILLILIGLAQPAAASLSPQRPAGDAIHGASASLGPGAAPDPKRKDAAPECGQWRQVLAFGRDLVQRGEALAVYGIGVFLILIGKAFIALGYLVAAVELLSC